MEGMEDPSRRESGELMAVEACKCGKELGHRGRCRGGGYGQPKRRTSRASERKRPPGGFAAQGERKIRNSGNGHARSEPTIGMEVTEGWLDKRWQSLSLEEKAAAISGK